MAEPANLPPNGSVRQEADSGQAAVMARTAPLSQSEQSHRHAVDVASALHGHAPLPGIVAVEPAGANAVTLYRRGDGGSVVAERETFTPWLLLRESDLAALPASDHDVVRLAGSGELSCLVRFPRWAVLAAAQAALKNAGADFFSYTSLVSQYLSISGRTLFSGMRFEDVHRLQVDIETASLRADASSAAVLMASITDSRGHEEVISAHDGGEASLLRRLTERIVALDPDVIEGHNLTDFDLPYLVTRALSLGVPLNWGRDGQPVSVREREGRLKVGARLLPSMRVHINGRHVVDTFQQVQRFDSAGKLESYGLKQVMEALELVRPDRQFVDRTDITALWERDPDQLAAYCLDDARDVRTLSELITPTEFYQTQIVPRSFQDVATGGTGEKINAILVRAYLAAGHAIPAPEPARPYPGGYSELREAGVFQRVVKCDVESLYPAVMLRFQLRPATDELNLFLPLLAELTERRLHAKHSIRGARSREHAYWTGLSSSYKVLINSFYGYLGYGRANFNDFGAAERVTTTGQRLIKDVLAALGQRGCRIIEVDTDGVYFVPPPDVQTEDEEVAFVEQIGAILPSGIRLAHDGRYAGMVSLKQKTYFLLTYDGRLLATGSSLRSRRDEPYLREFLQQAALTLIEGSLDDVSQLYLQLAERIQAGELGVEAFARRESVTSRTHTSPGLKRLAAAAKGVPVGYKVQVYQREDGSLALADDFRGDEDRDYLLRRLHDVARRFDVLSADEGQFRALFPRLVAKREPTAERPVQLSMFD